MARRTDSEPVAAAHNDKGYPALAEEQQGRKAEPVIIKKYANRRLYNTATSSYVTLDHLSQMVQDNVEFVVYDAKTGEDITRSVLTQIIVEEEGKGGQNLLPINFLRQLISFYGDNMKFLVPRYLEHMMGAFAQNQERLRATMQETMGNFFPFGNLEEMGKQNLALFEQAMRMWSPFGQQGQKPATPAATPPRPTQSPAQSKDDVARLQSELDQLKARIERLTGKSE
jgi:polyhydroxyalkanoate synthesis repressor PhaR